MRTPAFGRYDAVVAGLQDRVAFNVNPTALTEDGAACALTVVAEGVSGQEATLSVLDVGPSWAGLEGQPEKRPSLTGGVIHEQLIAPSTAISVGTSFAARSILQIDGPNRTPAAFPLKLRRLDGDGASRWQLGTSRDVECHSASA